MNFLNRNVFGNQTIPVNNQQNNQQNNLQQNVRRVKQIMKLCQGNPQTFIQQNPNMASFVNSLKGQDLKSLYLNMCQSQGIDPNVILNELRN